MRLKILIVILYCVNGELTPLFKKSQGLQKLGREVSQIKKTSYDEGRYPCDSYYNYVCGERYYLHTLMMEIPKIDDLVALMNAIERDVPEGFRPLSAKVVNFYLSCGKIKSVDDCHRECFNYFRPIYAYIIAQKFSSEINTYVLGEMLDKFLEEARESVVNHANIRKTRRIRNQLLDLNINFSLEQINNTFKGLEMYRGNYKHNLKELEEFMERPVVNKNLVDFILFLYESRNMPISYTYATMNVHLWMSLFNSTDRQTHFNISCFQMPSYLIQIDEARVMANVYYHSFLKAWDQYYDYSRNYGKDVVAEENVILKDFDLDNDELFLIFYAQNFCQFGKEIADNVFYQGVKLKLSCPSGSSMNTLIKCEFEE